MKYFEPSRINFAILRLQRTYDYFVSGSGSFSLPPVPGKEAKTTSKEESNFDKRGRGEVLGVFSCFGCYNEVLRIQISKWDLSFGFWPA